MDDITMTPATGLLPGSLATGSLSTGLSAGSLLPESLFSGSAFPGSLSTGSLSTGSLSAGSLSAGSWTGSAPASVLAVRERISPISVMQGTAVSMTRTHGGRAAGDVTARFGTTGLAPVTGTGLDSDDQGTRPRGAPV